MPPPTSRILSRGSPKSMGAAKLGVERASPPGGWGVSHKRNKKGAGYELLPIAHVWDPWLRQTQSSRGRANWRVQGQAPAGGFGDVPLENKIGGKSQTLAAAHEWDSEPRQTRSPQGWAKSGVQGACHLPGGLGDVPPENKIGGKGQTPAAAHEWDSEPRQTQSPQGWAKKLIKRQRATLFPPLKARVAFRPVNLYNASKTKTEVYNDHRHSLP